MKQIAYEIYRHITWLYNCTLSPLTQSLQQERRQVEPEEKEVLLVKEEDFPQHLVRNTLIIVPKRRRT